MVQVQKHFIQLIQILSTQFNTFGDIIHVIIILLRWQAHQRQTLTNLKLKKAINAIVPNDIRANHMRTCVQTDTAVISIAVTAVQLYSIFCFRCHLVQLKTFPTCQNCDILPLEKSCCAVEYNTVVATT